MPPNVLVLDADPFVAEDIVQAIRQVLPDAATHVVTDVDAACLAMLDVDTWVGAVLRGTTTDLERTELQACLLARDLRPVVIHEELDLPGTQGWMFVPPPFTTESLMAVLGGAFSPRPSASQSMQRTSPG